MEALAQDLDLTPPPDLMPHETARETIELKRDILSLCTNYCMADDEQQVGMIKGVEDSMPPPDHTPGMMPTDDTLPPTSKLPPLDTPPPVLPNVASAPVALAPPRRLGGKMHAEIEAEMEAEMQAEMEALEKRLCTPSTVQALENDLCCTPSAMQELQNYLDRSTTTVAASVPWQSGDHCALSKLADNASPSEVAAPEKGFSLGGTPTSLRAVEGDLGCSMATATQLEGPADSSESPIARWQATMREVLSRGDLAENNHRLLAPLVACAACDLERGMVPTPALARTLALTFTLTLTPTLTLTLIPSVPDCIWPNAHQVRRLRRAVQTAPPTAAAGG